jgi:nucleoside-diphosphate-sugar epimerase
MARLARFDLDCRLADATDQHALQAQLKGCDVLFHCTLGGRDTILASATAAYRAAAGAGVRRLVYLSTAVVHGMDPAPGTHDDSELVARQPFEYNVSKVMAEDVLRRQRSDGAVEVVTLRPAIVFGPRSQWWSAQIARDILNGDAYLIDGGEGVCNTVYIDNLVHAMWQAALSDRAANQAFLITDAERVTWRDLYGAVAEAIGVDIETVPRIASEEAIRLQRASRRSGLPVSLTSPALRRVARRVLPRRVVESLKALLSAANATDAPRRPGSTPAIDLEMLHLQRCRYHLPINKATELLHYTPPVTFSEGCRRTGEWLRFVLGLEPVRP